MDTNLNDVTKSAVEEYQCSGCISGSNTTCYEKSDYGTGCGSHSAGTFISNIGKVFLGLPKGFNRVGKAADTKIRIFETYDNSTYDMFNIPTWKYLNNSGHTIVRGIMPRRNEPFIHIFLTNCIEEIKCLEITEENINNMD